MSKRKDGYKKNGKLFITAEQAISVLPEDDTIAARINVGFGMLDQDWDKIDLIYKIKKSGFILLSGPRARSLNYGICIFNNDLNSTDELLFIQTDKNKLSDLEKKLYDRT